MTKAQLAEKYVDKMIENGRFGPAETVTAEDRAHRVWLVKKLHVATLRLKYQAELAGTDSRTLVIPV